MMVTNDSVIGYLETPKMEVTLNLSGSSLNSSVTNNQTNGGIIPHQKDPMISLTVPAIMFASGVFGNILAIFVLWRSSRDHKQTVFYRLVGALAMTDLFGTCATSPITLAVYANKLKWVGGDALCEYEGFMLIFAGFSTIFIVGSMAVDRYLAIKHPFFYDQHISFEKAKYLILTLWIIAVIISSLPLIGLGDNIKQFPGTWCFFTFTSRELKNQIFAYFYATLGLFVIGVTAVSNVFVTIGLVKMRRRARRNLNLSNTKRHDSELQMMVLLLGIIVIFSTCWCPFMIRIIINQVNLKQIDVKADLHALRLASLNQILDPWIYILFRKELFLRTLKVLKDNLAFLCSCICIRRGLIRRLDNNNLQHSSHYNKAVELCENGHIIDRGAVLNNKEISSNGSVSRKSTDSYAAGDMEETLPLRPETGYSQEMLNLKHSACLFCLGNHPKRMVLSSLNESKSVEELKHLCDEKRTSAIIENKSPEPLKLTEEQRTNSTEDTNTSESVVTKDKSTLLLIPRTNHNNRRNSIHLSLENLRKDDSCPCLHHLEERATRC